MVRTVPLPFADMMRALPVLRRSLEEDASKGDANTSLKDGFCMNVNDLVFLQWHGKVTRECKVIFSRVTGIVPQELIDSHNWCKDDQQ